MTNFNQLLVQAADAFRQTWLDFFANGKPNGQEPLIENQLVAWKQNHDDAIPDSEVFEAFLRAELDAHAQQDETQHNAADYRHRFPQFTNAMDAELPTDDLGFDPNVPLLAGSLNDAALPPLMRGTCFGEFELLGRLGRGGMGEVWLAKQVSSGKLLAIKFPLLNDFTHDDYQRFCAEAAIHANLDSHSNIVQLFWNYTHLPVVPPNLSLDEFRQRLFANRPFLVMEFVQGRLAQKPKECTQTLRDLIAGDPLTHRRIAEIMLAISRAIAHAHSRNIYHRDLKPGNVLFSLDGQPKLSDFGMAIPRNQQHGGKFGGTPLYMSPEQLLEEKDIYGAADVWALGVLLFECLTRNRPFVSTAEILDPKYRHDRLPADVHSCIAELCDRCLNKQEPHQRPQAKEFAEQVQQWLMAIDQPPSTASQPANDPFVVAKLSRPEWFETYLQDARQYQGPDGTIWGFAGREWLFREITGWVDLPERRAVRIKGDYGVGKTAIIGELAQNKLNPLHARVLALHCCRHNMAETLSAAWLVGNLAAQLAEKLPAYCEQLADPVVQAALRRRDEQNAAYSALEKGVLEPLAKIAPPEVGVCFWLIDALDESIVRGGGEVDSEIARLLRDAACRFPSWLRLIVTTRPEQLFEQMLGALHPYAIDAESQANQDDLQKYVQQRLTAERFRQRLAESNTTVQTVVTSLVEKSEGRFLYVVKALEAVYNGSLTFARLHELPAGMEPLYGEFFERLFPKQKDYQPVRPVVQLLLAAGQLLTREQSIACFDNEQIDRVDSALATLSQFLRDGHGGYQFNHKSLYDWLGRPGTPYFADPAAGHRRLADWCQRELDANDGPLSDYLLRHFPTHLIADKRWDFLAALLLEPRFLEAKAEAGLVFGLVTDFGSSLRALPRKHDRRAMLELVEEALRTDVHLIAEYPFAMFQCFWNRCWWYDAPAAAAHYVEPDGGWTPQNAPWLVSGRPLSSWMEKWRALKERKNVDFTWFRSTRPPSLHLGTAQKAVLTGHAGLVNSVAIYGLPGAERIVSGASDNTVRIWNAATGEELRRFDGHKGTVYNVTAYGAPGAERIVSSSDDCTVRIWDAATGEELQQLQGTSHCVPNDSDLIVYGHTGAERIVVTAGKTIKVWDSQTGSKQQKLKRHVGCISNVIVYNESGQQRIAFVSFDLTMRILNAEAGAKLRHFKGHEGLIDFRVRFEEVYHDRHRYRLVGYNVGGKQRLVTGSKDGIIRTWDAETGTELLRFTGYKGCHQSLAVYGSPGAMRMVFGTNNGLRICDAETGARLRWLAGHTGRINSVAVFGPPGAQRIVSGSDDKTIRIWDAESGDALRQLHRSEDVDNFRAGYGPPGKQRIVCFSQSKSIRILDTETGAELLRLKGHKQIINSVAVYGPPDAQRIVSGSDDHSLLIWNAQTGAKLRRLIGHTAAVKFVVVFGLSGAERIVSGSDDHTLRIWDPVTGTELRQLEGHEYPINFLRVYDAPGGQLIVSSSQDETFGIRHIHQNDFIWFDKDGKSPNGEDVNDLFPVSKYVEIAYATGRRVLTWNADTGAEVSRVEGKEGNITWGQLQRDALNTVFAQAKTAATEIRTHDDQLLGVLPQFDEAKIFNEGRCVVGRNDDYVAFFCAEGDFGPLHAPHSPPEITKPKPTSEFTPCTNPGSTKEPPPSSETKSNGNDETET